MSWNRRRSRPLQACPCHLLHPCTAYSPKSAVGGRRSVRPSGTGNGRASRTTRSPSARSGGRTSGRRSRSNAGGRARKSADAATSNRVNAPRSECLQRCGTGSRACSLAVGDGPSTRPTRVGICPPDRRHHPAAPARGPLRRHLQPLGELPGRRRGDPEDARPVGERLQLGDGIRHRGELRLHRAVALQVERRHRHEARGGRGHGDGGRSARSRTGSVPRLHRTSLRHYKSSLRSYKTSPRPDNSPLRTTP